MDVYIFSGILSAITFLTGYFYARHHWKSEYDYADDRLSKCVRELHRLEGACFNMKIERDEWELKAREAAEENDALQKHFKDMDIINSNQVLRIGYINIFEGYELPRSRSQADIFANEIAHQAKRIGCVRVDYVEGQFDD